jgi:hypothetical protein
MRFKRVSLTQNPSLAFHQPPHHHHRPEAFPWHTVDLIPNTQILHCFNPVSFYKFGIHQGINTNFQTREIHVQEFGSVLYFKDGEPTEKA